MPHDLVVPAVFLFVSIVGAVFTLNAHVSLAERGYPGIAAFIAGWVTSELPIVHVVWQLGAVLLFAAAGGLGAWPGWLALGLCLISWWMLLGLHLRSRGYGPIVESALVEALGPGYRSSLAPETVSIVDRPPAGSELVLPLAAARAGVERVRHIAYGPAGRRNHLDIFRRRDRPQGCPVLINLHGGAWVVGDKREQAMPLLHYMASLGWICVAINYRLSPRATFPDHIVDVKRAIAWVKAHIAEYGGDPEFVAIGGGSAGGHLASLAALTPNDPLFQPGFEGADTSVRACVPFYGVYDFTNRHEKGRRDLVRFLEKLVMKRRLVDARQAFEHASPMSHVRAEAPPFLIIHGANDVLVPVEQARLFADMLRAVSHEPVAYVELPEAQHAFDVFSSPTTAHVIRGVARFLSVVHAAYKAKQGSGSEAAPAA